MRSKTIAGLVLAGTAALAACGGGTGYSTGAPSTNSAGAQTAVMVSHTELGDVLVEGRARTLYGFTNDVNGTSTCTGTCAESWFPLTARASWKSGPGVADAHLHTIKRADGQLQLAAGKWPLYTFTGDNAPGDVNGQGSLGKWFVVRPDGSLNKDSTPAPTTPAMSGYGY